jgi:hypothetical protein
MGCDIHALFQARRSGTWVDVHSFYEGDRDYELFAWLAGARNRFGITPIRQPRGLPAGFPRENDDLGDHTFSCLTADEILDAPLPSNVPYSGLVSRDVFDAWDGVSAPREYCQGASGPNVVIAESPEAVTPASTYVRVEWFAPASQFDYFLGEIRRLKDEHGEVRMVFGFDS